MGETERSGVKTSSEATYFLMDESDAPYEDWEIPYKRTMEDHLGLLKMVHKMYLKYGFELKDDSGLLQLRNKRDELIYQKVKGKWRFMAHHSVGIKTLDNRPFPEEIFEKAKELCYLFRGDVEWHFLPHKIYYCFPGWWYGLGHNLEDELKENRITQNMVDFYKWAKENMEAYADCWNACDNDYGPDSMEELTQQVERALKKVKEWREPVKSRKDLNLNTMFLQLDPREHVIRIELNDNCFFVEVPNEVDYLWRVSIQYGVIEYRYGEYGKNVANITLWEQPQVLKMPETERLELIELLTEVTMNDIFIDHYKDALNSAYWKEEMA